MQLTYTEELAQLIAELLEDEPTLTPEEAAAVAERIITPLYYAALEWNNYALAMRPVRSVAA